jgi:starch phosphorylase
MSSLNNRALPNRIDRLHELAGDLWWSWNTCAGEVFRRLDYPLWRTTNHNPIEMLRLLPDSRFEEVATEPAFLDIYDTAIEKLLAARSGTGTWWRQRYPDLPDISVAYFSTEFAVHQSVPFYAGGLGVLAGDHCKEASDLGVPLIGVGFRYSRGYLQQTITAEGWQVESYDHFAIDEMPLDRAYTPAGEPCTVVVPVASERIHAVVWLLKMGRVRLYLLDTDVEQNPPWGRDLSANLYVGERETRLRQEVVLGIGGVRALRALGHSPAIWHLNEGHVAFVIAERLRELLESGDGLEAALQTIRSTTVFTSHTPVPAGHDTFSCDLVEHHLSGFDGAPEGWRQTLMQLGVHDYGNGGLFNMTALALRGSGAVNAVSRVHQEVSRRMFVSIEPNIESSLHAITNGVHVATWIAPSMDALLKRHLAEDWKERHDDPTLWEQVFAIPDEELWDVHQDLKAYLLAFVREHARRRWTERQTSATQLAHGGTLLDPSALIIGFGRRFTEYKRPELIFQDEERLARLLTAPHRPVQLIFGGKAHPSDEPGKQSLQGIYRRASDPRFGGRIAFVDDYDLHVGHFFVQGCDVWLNNPRKPLEACGTSGMKASMNGVLHMSVADGWWSEGYTGLNGWVIDPGERSDDEAEAECIYRVLEEQAVPAFYERDERGIPLRWIAMVKQAMWSVAPRFSARRMVKEYVEQMYLPLYQRLAGGEKAASAVPREGN